MPVICFVVILTFALAAIIQGRPIDDVDIFTQLRIGTHLIGSLVNTGDTYFKEFLTYQHELSNNSVNNNGLVYNPGWLSQVILSMIYHVGGWRLVRLLHAFVFSVAFGGVLYSSIVQNNSKGKRISNVSYLIAFSLCSLVSISSSSVRAQGIAFVCFSIVFMIRASKLTLCKKLFSILAVGLFWQNCHTSIILSVIFVGSVFISNVFVYVFAKIQKPFFLKQEKKSVTDKNAIAQGGVIMQDAGILLMLCCAQFLTPLGFNVLQVSKANYQISRKVLFISEWMPAWHESVFSAMHVFWGVSATVLILCALSFKKYGFNSLSHSRNEIFLEHGSYLISCGVFFMLTLCSARFCVFWALIMIPVIANLIELVRPSSMFNWYVSDVSGDSFYGVFKHARGCIMACALLSLVFVGAIVFPVQDKRLPISCVVILKNYVTSGRIYNYREWGGILSWYGSHIWRVAIDGRLYLYPKSVWKDYDDIALGNKSVKEVVERYSPDAFFLRKSYHQGFIEKIDADAGWAKVCEDELSIAYVPVR